MPRVIDPTTSEAIGTIKPWIRASASIPLPVNYVICDGSLVVDPDSPFDSGSGFTVPDLRARFARGHATLTNATFAAASTYILGGAGLVTSGNDLHSHTGTTDSQGSHSHTVSSHTHSISSDGSHTHDATSQIGPSSPPRYASDNGATPFLATASNGAHTHGGATGFQTSSVSTDSQGSHSHNLSISTGANVPANIGFIQIMKIK